MLSRMLALILFAVPALAEPHAYIVFNRNDLPDPHKRGSFNYITTPLLDTGHLRYYRAVQEAEAERGAARARAAAAVPRIINNTVVVIQRDDRRHDRDYRHRHRPRARVVHAAPMSRREVVVPPKR